MVVKSTKSKKKTLVCCLLIKYTIYLHSDINPNGVIMSTKL